MTIECLQTLTSIDRLTNFAVPVWVEVPYLHGFIETSCDKLLAIWGERNTVHRVLVAEENFKECSSQNTPDADAAIHKPSCDQLAIGGNRNRRNVVISVEC